ncbi:hypothetical protein MOSE0_G03488 [Monosporozyma servazzii]
MNLVIFSGGTATNALTPSFYNLTVTKGHELTYVLPISDNGGSTSEILRVLGGPAIGDIRSRIVRLIEDEMLVNIFSYRLPDDNRQAKVEWNDIVEGSHPIWNNISPSVKEMVRAFLIHIQAELLKKNKGLHNKFNFEKASIGNLFLTGARLFLGSLDASIELMMRIGRCNSKVNVIPCINTSHTHHISALLTNGDVITGQSQISHPSKPSINRLASRHSTSLQNKNDIFEDLDTELAINSIQTRVPMSHNHGSYPDHPEIATPLYEQEMGQIEIEDITKTDYLEEDEEEEEEEEFANPIYILPELKNSQLHFDKQDEESMLPAPVKRILYINPYGEEIKPNANIRAISKIKSADIIVYSIGSVMTSLLPIIILGNLANTILEKEGTHKVLIINNKYDRETYGLDAIIYVKMIIDSMIRSIIGFRQKKGLPIINLRSIPWNKFITDIIYLTKGQIQMDWDSLSKEGIKAHAIDSDKLENENLEDVLNKIHSSELCQPHY